MPLVSVVMPVFNGEAFLKAAMDSILSQTFQDFELLLINDGSTDGSRNLIQSYQDSRIRLLDNDRNRGLVYSRNRGLAEAKSSLVALLDADDVAVPERIAIQYEYMMENPELVMTGGHAEVIDAMGTPTGECYKMPVRSADIQAELLFRNVFVNSTVMYRKEAVEKIGGYQGPDFCEDYHLVFRMAQHYQVENLDKVLVRYRVHKDNISREKEDLMLQGERDIVRSMHRSLHIPYSDPLQETHLSFIRQTNTKPQLRDYFCLFKAIKEGNDKTGIFPKDLLHRVLFTRWYELIRQSRSRMSLLLFFRRPLFNPAYATPKMYRKMFKQVFGLI